MSLVTEPRLRIRPVPRVCAGTSDIWNRTMAKNIGRTPCTKAALNTPGMGRVFREIGPRSWITFSAISSKRCLTVQ